MFLTDCSLNLELNSSELCSVCLHVRHTRITTVKTEPFFHGAQRNFSFFIFCSFYLIVFFYLLLYLSLPHYFFLIRTPSSFHLVFTFYSCSYPLSKLLNDVPPSFSSSLVSSSVIFSTFFLPLLFFFNQYK